jgi:hypothetical protein
MAMHANFDNPGGQIYSALFTSESHIAISMDLGSAAFDAAMYSRELYHLR